MSCLDSWGNAVVEMAYQDSAGGLGLDEWSIDELIERRAKIESRHTRFDSDTLEERAKELLSEEQA